MIKRYTASILILIICLSIVTEAAGINSKGAAYVGGTVATFQGSKNIVPGSLNTTSTSEAIFAAGNKEFIGQQIHIPWKSVTSLEYGQKAGRRVGAAAATTVLLGPIGLLTLFSKKKNHYLTVAWKDDKDVDQVAVLELGKDIVRTTLPVFETRSGKQIEYQDDDARKSAGKAK